jgi:hypothetical protein
MLTRSTIALATAAIVLGATVSSTAKDGGPPNIDIQKTCRESSTALGDLTGSSNQDSFSTCMNDEQTAREKMVKDWASYPALAKTQCVQPTEYLPGYVEWQACLEMTRDVINLRKQQAASTAASSYASGRSTGRGTRSQAKECPIVQTTEDGSIDWVINC